MKRSGTPTDRPKGSFILFDDGCAVCRRAIQFIEEHDARRCFEFVPRRSSLAQALIERARLGYVNSVVLVNGDRAYTRSAALLGIVRRMPWPWKLLSGLAVIPSPLLDILYDAFARRRHRWSSCDSGTQPYPNPRENACACTGRAAYSARADNCGR